MPSLTHTEAAERGRLLTVHSYHVDLDLSAGDDAAAETFPSTTRIAFSASAPEASTFLDVKAHTLRSVVLNGKQLDVTAVEDGRLPLTGLTEDNELVVAADMAYSREGEGLHRYSDPADGLTYVYAFAYLDNAPRVFACFDQPDLKAPYTFTVSTPPHWHVLGNVPATQTAPGRWELPESPALPTYLVTIVAGPYASVHAKHDGIDLGLYSRASLADALKADSDEAFEITRQCLDACTALFGPKYPFGKLDQVFAPEFSILSLDHPGCILLREPFLFGSSAATNSERETRAVVLAHGISLMWLAGLVTNTWWDDLWLGQCFADYTAHRITAEATRFPGPPVTFAARRKGQAYTFDQRPSTHPVRLEGRDVQTVQLELDRISYFKGHSVIDQLAATVGDDALKEGLRIYFARHAFGAATFADFIAAMTEATGADMTQWAEIWFNTPNFNTLTPEITVTDGKITAAAISQEAPASHPTLRPHTLDIGLYPGGEKVRARIDGTRTEVPGLIGKPAPGLLLLNDGDLTYSKIRFDQGSQQALPGLLGTLSPLNRGMVWCQLLLGVKDGAFPAAEHLRMVSQMIAVEDELSIIAEVLEQARNDVADRFLDRARRPELMALVADALRTRLATTPAGDEKQITLFRGLIDFTADQAELGGWLEGAGLPDGVQLDADLGWRVRYRLAVLGGLDANDIKAAREAQPGGQTPQWADKCEAARPDPDAKQAAWQAMMTEQGLSSYGVWARAEGFWQPEQDELTEPYVERFFREIPDAARLRGDRVLETMLIFLYPRFAATRHTLDLAAELLARDDLSVPLRTRTIDFTDDLRRVVEARETGA